MRTRIAALAALIALAPLFATACAVLLPNSPEAKLHDSQLNYTQCVRWANFEKAQGFVAPEARREFQARASELGGLRFTDYRLLSVDLGPDKKSATAHVTYIAYRPASPVAVAFDEEQRWELKDGIWVVNPVLTAARPAQPGEVAF
jgi:hypothetical protein